jgi:hypothetical protein
MMRNSRVAFASLAIVLLSACGGSTSSTRDAASPFTAMPSGNEDQDELFLAADDAFYAGDYVTAQRLFGSLFILNPAYRGGVSEEAIQATCDRLGVECDLVMGRLEIQREVFANRWGPPSTWVQAQRDDYASILACYENALMGDPHEASRRGTPVLRSPDPYFAASARRCVSHVQAEVEAAERQRRAEAEAAERQRRADEALGAWFENQPCMDENRQRLLAAYTATDWEAFVTALPAYRRCAQPLQQIIDDGVLSGDPRVGVQHDIAWSDMSEIDAILEDNADTIRATRDGLVRLDQSPEYQGLLVEYDAVAFEETRLQNQIGQLQTAAANLSGNARTGVENQIANVQTELIGVRAQKREVMASINRLRREAGLEARETP